jgi:predicted ATP-grasp superfamily ATP-dependent carboligase
MAQTDGGLMQTTSTNVVILSPGLSQSFAIANLLRRHFPDCDLLGYRLPGEKDPAMRPFVRYIDPSEGEAAVEAGAAIMTGEASTQYAMRKRDSASLGQIEFERRNLWFYDKAATLQLAQQLDIPIPKTWTSLEEIANYPGAIFCKPALEGTSGRRIKVRSRHKLPDSMYHGRFLFQEVIEGPSVIGFGFLADRGKIVAAKIHHEILSYPLDGGSAVAVEAYHAPRVEELAKRLIADFRYSGWGLVEFKPCPKRGDFVLMELNAKFWASLEFTLRTCPLFSYLLFGVRAKAEPIRRMIWPSRMLRNGLLRMPLQLQRLLPAIASHEALTWRDWARLVLPE